MYILYYVVWYEVNKDIFIEKYMYLISMEFNDRTRSLGLNTCQLVLKYFSHNIYHVGV